MILPVSKNLVTLLAHTQMHKLMRTLIVDDHKINYLLIKNLLVEYFPEVDAIDTVDSVKSALEMIKNVSYDVLFLDMQLKDGHGFDILKVLPDEKIFTCYCFDSWFVRILFGSGYNHDIWFFNHVCLWWRYIL